jgi:hypothetical protein
MTELFYILGTGGILHDYETLIDLKCNNAISTNPICIWFYSSMLSVNYRLREMPGLYTNKI